MHIQKHPLLRRSEDFYWMLWGAAVDDGLSMDDPDLEVEFTLTHPACIWYANNIYGQPLRQSTGDKHEDLRVLVEIYYFCAGHSEDDGCDVSMDETRSLL